MSSVGCLKANGFKWAPSAGAWQRQLNGNAMYAANRIEFIKPENGREKAYRFAAESAKKA